MDKKIYSIAFILLALFSLTQLATLLKSSLEINIYDIYTKITDFYSLFYFIIPLFTLFLLVFFIKVRNMEYAILRFLSRKELFLSTVMALFQLAFGFTITVILIVILESFTFISFDNNWSELMLSGDSYYYFILHPGQGMVDLLKNLSPLFYVIHSFLLLFLMFSFVSLLFYILIILTEKVWFAFISVLTVMIINIVSEIMFIIWFNPISLVKHVIPLEYIATYQLSGEHFPYQMYLFWAGGL